MSGHFRVTSKKRGKYKNMKPILPSGMQRWSDLLSKSKLTMTLRNNGETWGQFTATSGEILTDNESIRSSKRSILSRKIPDLVAISSSPTIPYKRLPRSDHRLVIRFFSGMSLMGGSAVSSTNDRSIFFSDSPLISRAMRYS